MAVKQTTFREAAEWLVVYVGLLPVFVLLLGILAEFYVFHILRKKILTRKSDYFLEKNRNKYLIIILAILSFYYPGKIIAELANRDKLHAYNAEYPFADTPWMDKNKGNEDFVFFTNAYACQSMTLQVLEQALTEKSAYNDKDLLEAMNFIDIAKAKGYKTYWITNLTGSNSGSFYGMIASRADCVYRENAEYDDNMLKFLAQVNPSENNLIVFHGNVSHANYVARYPAEDAVFVDGTVESEYANSIRYVDKFSLDFAYHKDNLYTFGKKAKVIDDPALQ